jgi:orotate phosphoribosyltransferase
LTVLKVVVLIDRQEMQGRESILKEVPDVEALLTREEIMERYRSRKSTKS